MSLLSQYVLHSVTEERHPTLNSTSCSNRRQKRKPCTLCKDVCPEGVFTQKQGSSPQWSACTDCNLCVTACPGRCLTPSAASLKSWLTGYDNSEIVRIGCSGYDRKLKIEEYCVASIPWEFLAYLALRKKIYLYLPCEGCEDSVARRLLDDQLENLRHFLGESLFSSRITLIRSSDDDPQEEEVIDRKQLMSRMTSAVRNQAISILPGGDADISGGLFFRSLLRDCVRDLYLKEKEQGRRTSFEVKLPHFTSSCYACQTCLRLCPQEAVSFGELKDGKRGIYIEPWKCAGCGVCQVTCRDNGIDGFRFMKVPHLDRLLVTRVDSMLCEKCGKPMKPDSTDTLCTFCRSRERIRPYRKDNG